MCRQGWRMDLQTIRFAMGPSRKNHRRSCNLHSPASRAHFVREEIASIEIHRRRVQTNRQPVSCRGNRTASQKRARLWAFALSTGPLDPAQSGRSDILFVTDTAAPARSTLAARHARRRLATCHYLAAPKISNSRSRPDTRHSVSQKVGPKAPARSVPRLRQEAV